jgi:centromeric protein E
VTFILKIQADN